MQKTWVITDMDIYVVSMDIYVTKCAEEDKSSSKTLGREGMGYM